MIFKPDNPIEFLIEKIDYKKDRTFLMVSDKIISPSNILPDK